MASSLPPRLMVRNSTYYFRICVPKDLAAIVGRRLVVRSLRTGDLRSARAKLPHFIVAAEAEFGVLRRAHQLSSRDGPCPRHSPKPGLRR
jgi:hypothetical protein